jgi:beta-N-acetylhexosaminidase
VRLPRADAAARRRRAALLAIAAVALCLGLIVGGGSGGGQPARTAAASVPASRAPTPPPQEMEAVKRLSPRKLAGAVIVLRFHGSVAPTYVKDNLHRGLAAGAILFRENAPSPGAVRALTRSLQKAAGGNAIICTDQEGGAIRTLPWAQPALAPPQLTTTAAAAAAAKAAARGLRSAGINVNLAPVADLGGPLMHARAYPGGPADVARSVAASVRAYSGTGVLPTAKHFPGLGGATANTDQTSVTINRSGFDLGARDLPPFKAAVAAGVPLVMISHAVYPAIDRGHIASQSRAVVAGLLRQKLGFKGVAITDSLEARAVTAVTPDPGIAAMRSIDAGVDAILTTGAGSHIRVLRALAARAGRDRAFRARLEEAAARVTALRRSLRG